jgi:streptomycin 6-kinase
VIDVTLPADVVAMAGRGAEWAAWVERLPGLVRGLVDEWGLVPDGAFRHGHCSLVLPVRAGTSAEDAAVLKVGFPDEESEHEHLALQHWHGDGAVRLLRADPRRRALLLERAGPEDLTTVDDVEACEIAAASYSRLHRAPLPQLRPLSRLLERWHEQLGSVPRGAPVPHRMVEHATSIARQLLGDPETDARLVHGDLHYGQVLRSDREPWLVTDPKPVNGDPHFEPAPLLWNRWDEVVASGDVRGAVRQRFFTVVDTALLDEDRARDFVVLRVVLNAVWELREHAPDRDWITKNIAVAKAVQD